jgi:tetratricopeptide (TPR) repeat protein/tRNA A-37 threonylcarbamoyl transferase component Bud32/TolB-like protein
MSDFRSQLEQSIAAQYTIERELGGGGMSRTYVATEKTLNRKVVIKVLAPELLAGVSVERFNREVLLAARLQHPHIVPVLGAGDANGLPWFSMPYVEGESVRARLARGPLAIGEVISILRDVARALAFAHANGVVHRDIKPDNVLLSAGSATVTDFGIAKAISASRTVAAGGTLTVAGTSIGTPSYMAPEQAAGDPATDHRADFYSFGVLAYELLSGQTPFHGLAPSRMLAAKLSETPRDIRELRPDTPVALAQIVMRCLEKTPDDRPQNGADIVKVLDNVTSSSAGTAAPVILAGGQIRLGRAVAMWAGATLLVALTAWAATAVIGLPDWVLPGSAGVMLLGLPIIFFTAYVQRTAYRAYTATPSFTPGGNTATQGTMATIAIKASPHVSWRRTWMGGAIAVGAFAALVLAFMVMRALGIGPAGSLIGKGAFGSKETIVVADFKSPASDTALGVTASEALRTDLAQSSNLKVLTRASVGEILRLMKKPADSQVPFTLAREVASREGAKAVLDGEISQIGGTYVIAAVLVSAQDGKELATFRETAKSQNEIVAALGAISKDIRSKVGESLKNVHDSNPLERVTTSSLPALKKYVEGLEYIAATGDNVKGRVALLEAVQLDSTFAMAWRRIAATYGTEQGSQALQQHAIAQAFKFRDHLSDDERLLTEGGYYDWGPTPDRERAISAYEGLIERDSTNRAALNNVGNKYSEKRDFAKAEDRFRRATLLDHPFGGAFANLVAVQAGQKKFAAADSTVARFEKTLPTHAEIPLSRADVAGARGDYVSADTILRNDFPKLKAAGTRAELASYLGSIETVLGRLRDGRRWMSQTVIDAPGTPAGAAERLNVMLDSAIVQAHFLNDAAGARATLKRALAQIPIESLAPGDRPWDILVWLAYDMHDGAAAKSYETSFEKDLSLSRNATVVGIREQMRGLAAMADNRPKDAIPLYGAAYKGDVGRETAGPVLAIAFDLANQPDSAITEFERYADAVDPYIVSRKFYYAGTFKRLGELYEAKGNTAKAIENYRKFVELWKDADPELQPAVRSAKDRLEALKRKGGKG